MNWLTSLMGIMGQLGRFFPNYIDGYRQAWTDNWRDAQMYNQVQNGQMQNLFAAEAFPLEYNMLADRAGVSRLNSFLNANNFYDQLLQQPAKSQSIDFYNQNILPMLNAQLQQAINPGTWQGTQQSNLMNVLQQNGFYQPVVPQAQPQQATDPLAAINNAVG